MSSAPERILSLLLRSAEQRSSEAAPIDSLEAWWRRRTGAAPGLDAPIDRAIAAAAGSDRLAWAFASGYQAALSALVPALGLDRKVALAATEAGGAHPRQIQTRLAGGRLDGQKRWITLASFADELLVLASAGVEPDGKNRLVLVRVSAGAPGVRITPMPEVPFAPEIPHAEVELAGAPAVEVLPGDGWDDYVKPFRTVEDLHVHTAALAYLIGEARRLSWPADLIEELLALVVLGRELCSADPSAPETHLAAGGLFALAERALSRVDAAFAAKGSSPAAERWTRDRPLFSVAAKARLARLERARARFSVT